MKLALRVAIVVPTLLVAAHGESANAGGKAEFEAASVRVNPPRAGFHFSSDTSAGGPGTSDPGMFRCSNCTLATLIAKAFQLQNYQFPGRTSLGDNSFDVMAKIPAGATREDFQAMLQNLLKDRFGLSYHFTEKNLRGYHLVIAAKGSKLKESEDKPPAPAAPSRFGQGEAHTHSGPVTWSGSASYKRDHQTTAELARMLSDVISLPVDDQTGLQGKYDIALTWSGDAAHSGDHAPGAFGGGGGHGDHGGDARPADTSGPTLFDALQSQLGLKLVSSSQAAARIFVVDHVQPLPTEN